MLADRQNFGEDHNRFNEWANIGAAVEFPLTGEKGLESFRWTLDVIFRY